MRETVYEYCTNVKDTRLLQEWDKERNQWLTPELVSCGSQKQIWWRCGKGHEWQARPYDRVEGRDCPYCAGRRVLAGFNDLAFTRPDIAADWHHDLNCGLTPQEVTADSHKIVWWQCKQGHSYRMAVKHRAQGRNCPYCGTKEIHTNNQSASLR